MDADLEEPTRSASSSRRYRSDVRSTPEYPGGLSRWRTTTSVRTGYTGGDALETEECELLDDDTAYAPRRTREIPRRSSQRQEHDQQRLVPPPLPRRQRHPLFYVGAGMCSLLLLWTFGIHLHAWWNNTEVDPPYYTQIAHRDSVIVADGHGHSSQARAFIDATGRLDILVVPNGDVGAAHIIAGPHLAMADPQHAMIDLTAKGTLLTVSVQGPEYVAGLSFGRQTGQWSTDLTGKQPGSQPGGKS